MNADIDPELDIVVRRSIGATWGIVAVAVTITVALTANTTMLALIPAAFVLGWLNLAGL